MVHHMQVFSDALDRSSWLALLSRASLEMLEQHLTTCANTSFEWLRQPETGLMMVRARVGGTGAQFNFGEMTITRCALRLASGITGVGYIAGRSHRKVTLVALADGLLQTDRAHELQESVLKPISAALSAQVEEHSRSTQSTRVDFFTIAREGGM